MTVSYQYDVASSASGGFIRLLFRWRGSVWKVVYRDMLIFVISYVLLTLLYQFALTESQQKIFERIVYFCSTFMDLIPLSFMLGFYVSFIAARWWSQFIAIPWPDKLMNIVAMYIPGLDEASRVVRRTLMRYLNLSLVLVLRSISMAVKRRFPTKEHLVEAGFMTKTELEMFQSVPSTEFNTFWIPCTWFINVLREARQECRITDSNGLKLIMEELNEFRSKCGLLWGYDWISIPLVYTQVVTMATYAFFVACMFGRQNVSASADPQLRGLRYDFYLPIFTIFQLMFYMGLLKVAEQLINPFGDDDEDFELNWIIDRHMKVSYLGVDTLNGTPPPLVKDNYYDELDVKLPYTEASKSYKKKTYRGSVACMQIPMEQQGMVVPDEESDNDEKENVSEGMGQRRPSMYTLFKSGGNKGSRSSSYTNLDNVSLDSKDWKSSLPNVAQGHVKNASGSMGQTPVVDLDKAKDDEMVLQEVVVDTRKPENAPLARSDSLHIPGTSSRGKKSSSLINIIRSVSPKIAPKFPREKLKSMFRKRKMSAVFPFFRVKGVRFTRDTKEHDGSSSEDSGSEIGTTEDDMELEITISNPELTEIEKQKGEHPYYNKHKAVSPEQLTKALSSLSRKRRNSTDGLSEDIATMASEQSRCISLPNIQDELESLATKEPHFSSPCKPLSGKKDKSRRPKKKRKSPPPLLFLPVSSDPEKDQVSDTSDTSRRYTLPHITVTKYEHRSPEHLDLAATTGGGSGASSGSDSGQIPKSSTVPKSPKVPSLKKLPDSGTKPPPAPGSRVETPKPQSEKIHSQDSTKRSPKHQPPTRTTSLSLPTKPSSQTRTGSPSRPKHQVPKIKPPLRPVASLSSSDSAPPSPTRIIPTLRMPPALPQSSTSPRPSISSSDEQRDSRRTLAHRQQSDPEDSQLSGTEVTDRSREPPKPVPRKGSRAKK